MAGGARELNLIAQDITNYGADLAEKPTLELLIRELAAIEELRLLSCIDTRDRRIVSIALTGQPSLDDVLDRFVTAARPYRPEHVVRLTADEIEMGFHDVPTYRMEQESMPLVDLLVAAGVVQSKRQARQDVENGAVYLNGARCTDVGHVARRQDGLHGQFLIIRKGKKSYCLVR